MDDPVIQLDLEVVIISEAGPRFLRALFIQWNIIPTFYDIPDTKAISLNIVLHFESPEWIVVPIETRGLVWGDRYVRKSVLISIHH